MEKKDNYFGWMSIDWADEKHEIRLHLTGSDEIEKFSIKQKPEELHGWLSWLRKRVNGGKVAVAIEQRRGPVIYALMVYDFLAIFPIHTTAISNYRRSLRASGAKDDPFDADLLLDFMKLHHHRLRCLKPEDGQTRELMALTENRRKVVDEASAISNEITSLLKTFYPQALEMVSEMKSILACDFLKRWPTYEKLRKTKPDQLRKFYRKHNCRSTELIETRIASLSSSQSLTSDRAIIRPSSLLLKGLLAQLRALLDLVDDFDSAIAEVFEKHPDKFLYDILPGVGQALGPRLAAAMGQDRTRYTTAREIQQFSGIAPVTNSSGRRRTVRWRWACPKFLRQTFHEFASHSIPTSKWAAAYYRQQMAAGHSHHAAVRALAYKWIRIIYRCWENRSPYDENLYIQALKRRNSPLAKLLEG